MKFWKKKFWEFENFSKFFWSVTKMVLKVENFRFLRIFWFVCKKNFRSKFELFWNFIIIFFLSLKLFQKKNSYNFFTKRKFRSKPIFWFLFHQNRTTRKYFLRVLSVKYITNKNPFIGQVSVSVNISKAVSVSVKKIPIPHLHNLLVLATRLIKCLNELLT